MNRFPISRRSFLQFSGTSCFLDVAPPHNLLATTSPKTNSFSEVASETREAVSIPSKKFDPLGVFLANHGGSTGMQFWPLERWKIEIQNLKRMGARTVWYLPMQFGQRKEHDFDDDAPYWALQQEICKLIAAENLSVGIFVGLNDTFAETVDAHPVWKAKAGKYFLEQGEACPSHPDALHEIL